MKGFCALAIGLAVLAATVADGSARSIKDLEKEMIGLVEGVSSSIVSVTAPSGQVQISGDKKHMAMQAAAKTVGCGVVFEDGGLVLNTASVVGYARDVEVTTSDGARYPGTVVGVDPASDIAVIRADTDELKPARFADQVRLLPGSVILVLGNAFGSLPSVSLGMVSNIAVSGQEEGTGSMFGLSVAINPGDIGGPVVNTDGEVIGLVIGRLTFQAQPQAMRMGGGLLFGGAMQHSNMSVALPAARALGIAAEILEKGLWIELPVEAQDRPRDLASVLSVEQTPQEPEVEPLVPARAHALHPGGLDDLSVEVLVFSHVTSPFLFFECRRSSRPPGANRHAAATASPPACSRRHPPRR